MKLSLNWIQDYVKIPDSIELSTLVYDLTMSTVEVEEAIDLAREYENMVVGMVKEIRPHPDADKLVICMTDVGDTDINGNAHLREIVCGGINLSEGMKVAVARPGAKVRWHGEGDLVELKIAKVRGVESYGMICSSSEIGLFDLFPYTEDATIMDLSAFDAPAGTNLAAALGLDDVILVIDNKSLTNRPDLWGHYGMAREIAAIYDLPIHNSQFATQNPQPATLNSQATPTQTANPQTAPAPTSTQTPNFQIIIEDPELCPRYIGAKIENVSLKPAPFDIQSRIWRVGMRPINAIVDITNYIMLETGQPTHAFDADIVSGNIIVRRAKDGEKLLLLSGRELSLSTKDLVIADEQEAIALAGVMGGEKDSVLPETQNVILEIANFNALSVRRTSMRHDVRTEAATRFEKSIDPQRADLALATALRLFEAIYPEMSIASFHDNYPNPLQRKEVQVSLRWLEKRLGQKLSSDHISQLLERLGFEVSFDKDNVKVLVPSWRSTGDISLPDDIMEEIARIHGLENFEQTPIVTAFEQAVNQPKVEVDRKIREYFARTCGMNEIFTYPWVSEEYIAATLGEPSDLDMLEMASPPSPTERHLRVSLIPGLCKAVSENLRYFEEFAIFESAQVFFDKEYAARYDEREALPMQRRHIAGAFVAPREQYAEIYALAKGALEALPRAIHVEPLELQAQSENNGQTTHDEQTTHDGQTENNGQNNATAKKPLWADEVIWQGITHGGAKIGDIGLLSQVATIACGIKNAAVMLFEFDIDAINPLPSRENAYERIPSYPMTEYDVSLLFDTQTKWEDIKKIAAGKESPDNLLRGVSFVEEYKGSKIPAGKKSVTLRLTIGSLKKTLTSDEIESCAASAIKRLRKTLGGEIRV